MNKPRSTLLLILAVFALAVITVLTTHSRGQAPKPSSSQEDKYPHIKPSPGMTEEQVAKFKQELAKLPLAEYDAPEPIDPQDRAIRRARNQAHNHKIGKESSRLRLAELAVINNDWEWGLKSTIPAVQSSAVVVGEVIETRAFVSEDKTNVYSEFVIRVEDVLNNDIGEPVIIGQAIVIERLGGRIRFPGGISTYIVAGQGIPEMRKRYLIFLGYNPHEAGSRSPQVMNRHLLTAYELIEGKVYPLDHAGGGIFSEHAGKPVTSFLAEVKRALAGSVN